MNNRYLRQVEKELEQAMNLKRDWLKALLPLQFHKKRIPHPCKQ